MSEIEIGNQGSFGRNHDNLNESWSVNRLTTLVSSILGCKTIFELSVCGVYLLKRISI